MFGENLITKGNKFHGSFKTQKRYREIVKWATKRYTETDITGIGHNVPMVKKGESTRFALIKEMALIRYGSEFSVDRDPLFYNLFNHPK